MRSRSCTAVLIVFFLLAFTSCVTPAEISKQEYGALIQAVSFSAEKVIGEYGEKIPPDFSATQFMEVIKDKVPPSHYRVLKKFPLEIKPKGSYYLLLAFNPKDHSLILFHYSCGKAKPGAILNEPGKYDINNLDLYDKCKTPAPKN